MSLDSSPVVTLGGQPFRLVTESTFGHEIYFEGLIRKAGLDRMRPAEGETMDAFAVRLVDRVLYSDELLPIVGCLIVPADVEPSGWTREIAATTQAHVAALSDPAEIASVRQVICEALAVFFERGRTFSQSFQTSFVQAVEVMVTKGRQTRGRGGRGRRWFESLRTAISTVRGQFSRGRSARRSMPSAAG